MELTIIAAAAGLDLGECSPSVDPAVPTDPLEGRSTALRSPGVAAGSPCHQSETAWGSTCRTRPVGSCRRRKFRLHDDSVPMPSAPNLTPNRAIGSLKLTEHLVCPPGRRIWLCSATTWRQASNWGPHDSGLVEPKFEARVIPREPVCEAEYARKRATISTSDAARKSREWATIGRREPKLELKDPQ
jgi:hypothetical protein